MRALSAALVITLAACTSTGGPAPSTDVAASAPVWRQHDVGRPAPPRVEPAALALPVGAPSDAVVLIGPDGAGLEAWQAPDGGPAPWVQTDGALVVAPGTGEIRTRETFGDVQLHVEWQPAREPEKTSQNRSNSGIFLADGRYEVQILDVWDNPTYADGRAAAIYGQFPPLADAARPPTAWQSYDVFFRMPRFDPDGTLRQPARLTVLHNGVLVQNNEALPGQTIWLESLPYEAHGPGRIALQDHGSPVRFRNLWVRRIPERPAPPAGYGRFERVDLPADVATRYVGRYAREGGGHFVVERRGDGLGLSMPWRPGVLEMIPTSATTFELANTAAQIEIAPDGSALTMAMGGSVYPATRER